MDDRVLRDQKCERMLDMVAQLREAREDAISARIDMQTLMTERLLTTRPLKGDQVMLLDGISRRMSHLHLVCPSLHHDLATGWAIQGVWTGSTLLRMIFGMVQYNTLGSGRELARLGKIAGDRGLDSLVKMK